MSETVFRQRTEIHALVRAVDRHVNGRILIDVAKAQVRLDDQLLGLEAWVAPSSKTSSLMRERSMKRPPACWKKDAISVELLALSYDPFDNVWDRRAFVGDQTFSRLSYVHAVL